jgi:hypothetical protein
MLASPLVAGVAGVGSSQRDAPLAALAFFGKLLEVVGKLFDRDRDRLRVHGTHPSF